MASYFFVTIQFTAIAILAYNAFFGTASIGSLSFVLVGWIIGIWAIISMNRVSKLSVMPDPSNQTKLVIIGPYRSVRHPMYLAVLLFCLGLFGINPNDLSLVTYWVLGVNLIAKILYEEHLLSKRLKGYSSYLKVVKYRLLPWLW
jgi:protein-S-isoprenylcysteine O-methyltransferase Ste14